MSARITAVDDGALSAEYGGLRTLASTYRAEAGRLLGWCALGPRVMAELAPSVVLSPATGAGAERAIAEAVGGLGEQAAAWTSSAVAVEASLAAYELADGEAARLVGAGIGAAVGARVGPLGTLGPVLSLAPALLAPVRSATPGEGTANDPGAPHGGLWTAVGYLAAGPEWLLTHEPAATGQAVDLATGFVDGATGRTATVGSGAATVAAAYGPETGVSVAPVGSTCTTAPDSLSAAVDQLAHVSGAYAPMADGTIGITRIERAGGAGVAWIVDIPGTDDMSPVDALSGSTLRDMKENVRYVAGEPTAYSRGILTAMGRAGIAPGEPVMLVGHSQGGMAAQAVAQSRSSYSIRQVVTAGSPDVPGELPDGVRSLQLEHRGDLVPELDGRGPDASPRHLTVTFDSGVQGIVENHGFVDYDAGAAAVDASRDPRLVEQLAAMRSDGFLGGGVATTTIYRLTRAG